MKNLREVGAIWLDFMGPVSDETLETVGAAATALASGAPLVITALRGRDAGTHGVEDRIDKIDNVLSKYGSLRDRFHSLYWSEKDDGKTTPMWIYMAVLDKTGE